MFGLFLSDCIMYVLDHILSCPTGFLDLENVCLDTKIIRVRTVHEKTDRTQYSIFRPQFRPTQNLGPNSQTLSWDLS